jgi:hypothetical protein
VDGVIKIGDFGLVTALEDQEIELYSGEDAPSLKKQIHFSRSSNLYLSLSSPLLVPTILQIQ